MADVPRDHDERSIRFSGTILCADLSGFTRLTERLAGAGREGAEDVTAVLNASFGAILGPALEAGGDVLHFGGDSATMAFRDHDHAARAVVASAAMQGALGAVGGEGATGPLALRASIGIATGTVTAAVVGTEAQAVVLLGGTAQAAVGLQQRARAGQVVAGASVVAGTPGAPWRALTGGDAQLGWRRLAVEAGVPAPERIADTAPSELRRATAAFVLLSAGDAAAVADVAACVEGAAARWGVTWLATDLCPGGVAFLLTAGAPTATEYDEERMLLAIRSIVAAAPDRSMRVGVESGLVFAGDVGHPLRRSWTVIGDSVNVAARLAAGATPGAALVGPATAARAAHLVTADGVAALAVKGRRRPVAASALLVDPRHEGGPSASDGDARSTELLGREAELALLVAAWRDAVGGRGSAVEVAGEAGIGKSRLLDELLAVASDEVPAAAVDLLRVDPFRTAIPYATASILVRSAVGIPSAASSPAAGRRLATWVTRTAPHLAPWLPLLADAADATVPMTSAVERLDPEWASRRRQAAVVELLGIARRSPWLLVVEDLHRVDEASRGLLAEIAAAAPGHPWLVATSRRIEGVDATDAPDGPAVVVLGPLDRGSAVRLVLGAARRPMSDASLHRAVGVAGGNPLFLEQLAQHGGGYDDELPESVERMLAARIDTLAPRYRQLLRDASVLGPSVRLRDVADILEDPALARAPGWRELAGFVEVRRGTFGFRSELTRTVAYEGLSFRRRRLLHAAVADRLEARSGSERLDDDTCGLLALHLVEAGDAARAWPVALDAAGRAAARGALADAADGFRRALRLVPQLDVPAGELAAVHERHGVVCEHAARLDDALAAYAAASRLVADPVDEARLCSRRASVEQLRGELGRALRLGTKGLRLLEGVDGEAAQRVRARLALDQSATRHYQGHHQTSLGWAEAALEDALGTDDVGLLGSVYLHLELAHSMLGDGLAEGYGGKAVDLLEQAGDRKLLGAALVNVGLTALQEGRWTEADAAYRRAGEVAALTGNVSQAAGVAINRAFLLAELGEVEQAGELLADGERHQRAAGQEVFIGYAEVLGSRLALWREEHERSKALLDAARARFEEHGVRQMLLDCDVVRVEQLLHAGHPGEAVALARRVVAAIDAFGPAELLPATARRLLATGLSRSGRAGEAQAAAADALARARDLGARLEIALCLDAAAHAALAAGEAPDADGLEERDAILAGLGVRRTLSPLAR